MSDSTLAHCAFFHSFHQVVSRPSESHHSIARVGRARSSPSTASRVTPCGGGARTQAIVNARTFGRRAAREKVPQSQRIAAPCGRQDQVQRSRSARVVCRAVIENGQRIAVPGGASSIVTAFLAPRPDASCQSHHQE